MGIWLNKIRGQKEVSALTAQTTKHKKFCSCSDKLYQLWNSVKARKMRMLSESEHSFKSLDLKSWQKERWWLSNENSVICLLCPSWLCLWNLIKLDTFLLNAAVNSRKPPGKAADMDANGSVTIESASGRLVRSNHNIFRRLKAV